MSQFTRQDAETRLKAAFAKSDFRIVGYVGQCDGIHHFKTDHHQCDGGTSRLEVHPNGDIVDHDTEEKL